MIQRGATGVIARRFAGHWQRNYTRGKLTTDPLYAAAAAAIAHANPLPLMDVGCGMGLLGQYLHACNLLHGYQGIDHDERKIDAGRRAASNLGAGDRFHLQRADVSDLPDFSGHVALLDVLHYLPKARQAGLLAQLAKHVAPGGVLVIRNVLRESNWRFRATVLEETLLHWSGWMKTAPSHYPTAHEISQPLEDEGLDVSISPLWGRTPFNSYLIVARRSCQGVQST